MSQGNSRVTQPSRRRPIGSDPTGPADPGGTGPADPGNGGGSPQNPGSVIKPHGHFSFAPCLTDEIADVARLALQAAIAGELPDSYLQAACIDGVHRFGLWLLAPSNEAQQTAYDRGLSELEFVDVSSENAWAFGSEWLIRGIAEVMWADDDIVPKRWDIEGRRARLTGYHIGFERGLFVDGGFDDPGHVVTRVTGHVVINNRPNPDFTLTIRESLSIGRGDIRVKTDANLDIDVNFWPDPPNRDITDLITDSALAVGAQLAKRLNEPIRLPNDVLLTMTYRRVAVRDGIFLGGNYELTV